MWDVKCGALNDETSKIADWFPSFARRRLEAGDKADFEKFLKAMQRKGRIDVGDQTEAVDETSRVYATRRGTSLQGQIIIRCGSRCRYLSLVPTYSLCH